MSPRYPPTMTIGLLAIVSNPFFFLLRAKKSRGPVGLVIPASRLGIHPSLQFCDGMFLTCEALHEGCNGGHDELTFRTAQSPLFFLVMSGSSSP